MLGVSPRTSGSLNPIPGQSMLGFDKFRKPIVDRYLRDKSSFNGNELRHYRQLEISFEPPAMKELISRLQISCNITTLVFGGYTGQFANALQDIGMTIIFTDPLEEWVAQARRSGMEAHRYAAQEIPGNLLDRVQLVATFECYFSLIANKIYNILRFLTTKGGIVFAESEATRKELQAESAPGGMKFSFLPYYKVYSIRRVYREKSDLRIYHFYAPNRESREMVFIDAMVMKGAHDNLATESTLTVERLLTIPRISDFGEESLDRSLNRIMKLYYLDLSEWWRYELWTHGIWVGTKSFRLEETRLASLNV